MRTPNYTDPLNFCCPWRFVINREPRAQVARHMMKLSKADRRTFRDHLIYVGTYPLPKTKI